MLTEEIFASVITVDDHPLHSAAENVFAKEGYGMRERLGESLTTQGILASANKRNMEVVPNKVTRLNGSLEQIGEGVVAVRYALHELSGQQDGLVLDFINYPELRQDFHKLPQTIDEFESTVFPHIVIGGNGANLTLNQMTTALALKDYKKAHFTIVAPGGNRFSHQVTELQEQHPSLVTLHQMEDIPSRKSSHIPHRIPHERNRLDTLMITTPGPSPSRINEELERYQGLIQQATLCISQTDLPVFTRAKRGLVPTSSAIHTLKLVPGQLLLCNDGELLRLLNNDVNRNGHHGRLSLPSIVKSDTDKRGDASSNTSQTIKELLRHIAPNGLQQQGRIAQIGMRGGTSLGIFAQDERAVAVEASLFAAEVEDDIIAIANSPLIRRGLEEGTGRGDASAAGTILDGMSLDAIFAICRRYNLELPHDMADYQKQFALQLIPEAVGRMNSVLVHFSPESNFSHLPSQIYLELVAKYGILPSLRIAHGLPMPVCAVPQVLQDRQTGMKAGAWVVT